MDIDDTARDGDQPNWQEFHDEPEDHTRTLRELAEAVFYETGRSITLPCDSEGGKLMVAVQVLEIKPAGTSATTGKQTPPKVKFSNGIEAVPDRSIPLNTITVGAFGEAVIESKQNGQYTNHYLKSWSQTQPAGAVPPDSTPQGASSAPVEQSVWDAKDRSIIMEAANKASGVVTSAMIAAGLLTDEASIERVFEAHALKAYERTLLARADRIATKVNPFADE